MTADDEQRSLFAQLRGRHCLESPHGRIFVVGVVPKGGIAYCLQHLLRGERLRITPQIDCIHDELLPQIEANHLSHGHLKIRSAFAFEALLHAETAALTYRIAHDNEGETTYPRKAN